MVEGRGERHERPHRDFAVDRNRCVFDRADGDDRGLRRVENGREALDAIHAEVRDRKSASLEIFLTQLVLARACNHVRARCGDLSEMEPLGVLDDRDDEALRRRDRDADVRGREEEDRVVAPLGVHLAVPHERGGGRLREHVGNCDARVRVVFAEALEQPVDAAHVGRGDELEDGDLPCLGETASDRAADARQRYALDRSGHGRGLTPDRGGRDTRTARRGALDVLGDDPALRAGALERAKLDAALARDAAGERRGLDARAGPVALDRLPRLGDLLRRRCGPALGALGLPSRRLGGLLRALRRAAVPELRDVFALLADHGNGRADVGLALGDGDLEQDTRGLGLDLLRHLVGVELVERLSLLDPVAFGLQPFDDRPGLHALAEAGELYLASHGSMEGLTPQGSVPTTV